MRISFIANLVLFCPLAFAQVGGFAGPGVLSRGGGGVGQRSGQDVELRYFVNATGVYDTGLTPYAVTSTGELVQPDALYGIELGGGAYGRHTFRRSALGVDYYGNLRRYANGSNFNGSNQQLSLDYTHQKSRRLVFDFSGGAGIQNFGTAFGVGGNTPGSIVDSSSLLFDNRTSYHQVSLTTRYAVSGRTTISMGGSHYGIYRKSSALVGVTGYNLQGSIAHRISRNTIVGATYQHTHYDFPRAFGESDIDMYTGNWSTILGRSVQLAVSAGVFMSATQGIQSTALDPAIAALLGIDSIQSIFYRENLMPMGTVSLTKSFRRSSLSASYGRTVLPGNGVFLTSRQEFYNAGYAYTGFRRWSLSVNGAASKLDSIGQDLIPLKLYTGSANVGYNLGRGFNVNGAYMRRYQDLQANTFQRDSSRISFGIYFSPGSVPISFH